MGESEGIEALYLESPGDPGERVRVYFENGKLSFSGASSSSLWEADSWNFSPVEGSNEKWYFRQKDKPFPLLFFDRGVPAFVRGKKHFLFLPGLAAFSSLFVLLILIGLFAWFGLPFLADQAVLNLPSEWEVSIGKDIRNQTLATVEEDHRKSRLLSRLLRDYRFYDEKKTGIKPVFFVVKNSEFNAFAMPGGGIFVHDGALKKVRNLPELLALIGHENGRVQGRHGIRTMVRSLGLYGFIGFFFGDVSGLAAVLLENAQSLQNLSYSRTFEREADRAASDFLCRNGIGKAGLSSLMETMKSTESVNSGPAFLSSHPLTAERLSEAKKIESAYPCASSDPPQGQVELFQLLQEN